MPFPNLPEYTYLKERMCPHCGSLIPDQVHASIKYCPKTISADGSVISCKDDYHSPLKKIKNRPFKAIADYHKLAHKQIKSLVQNKGEYVTLEHLHQYQISLNRSIEWEVNADRIYTFYFVEYAITQFPNNQFKISKHGRTFR